MGVPSCRLDVCVESTLELVFRCFQCLHVSSILCLWTRWLVPLQRESQDLQVVYPAFEQGMVGQHFVPRAGLAPLRDFQGLWPHLVRRRSSQASRHIFRLLFRIKKDQDMAPTLYDQEGDGLGMEMVRSWRCCDILWFQCMGIPLESLGKC